MDLKDLIARTEIVAPSSDIAEQVAKICGLEVDWRRGVPPYFAEAMTTRLPSASVGRYYLRALLQKGDASRSGYLAHVLTNFALQQMSVRSRVDRCNALSVIVGPMRASDLPPAIYNLPACLELRLRVRAEIASAVSEQLVALQRDTPLDDCRPSGLEVIDWAEPLRGFEDRSVGLLIGLDTTFIAELHRFAPSIRQILGSDGRLVLLRKDPFLPEYQAWGRDCGLANVTTRFFPAFHGSNGSRLAVFEATVGTLCDNVIVLSEG